ncbi:hypothetical protein PV328_002827 [Microctonus aethiopoides]|uniref:Uncharacterized protein n=1 Tax=Microctonus aethiopoides TaxID=144406 RepID=A0AA39KJV0_9HYME|nr:hypothetical protein PV328_002827 [Microctonus aethiopoides]
MNYSTANAMSKMKNGAIINRYQYTANAFPTTMILIMIFLYTTYGKCLHLLFRRMQYPMVARRRIIDGLWCSGFAIGSMLYLKYLVPESLDTACLSQKPRYLELGFILHKSFYLHRSIIEIFNHGTWLQGWTNLLFCLIIHGSSEQKWFDVVTKLLFYKASVTAIINVCRVLLTVKIIKYRILLVKILLGFYSINWIYLHTVIVPDFQWWNTHGLKNDWFTFICMWIWFFFEFLNEINNIRITYRNSNQWMEAYLFPPPTEEMIELNNICKKLRESSNNKHPQSSDSKKVADLWQTISCAMLMKKKAKRLREAKMNSQTSVDNTN